MFMGRADDLLKVNGIYVSPIEVENALTAHPDIKAAAAVGVPDDHGLIKPVAAVECCNPIDPQALDSFLRARPMAFKIPRHIAPVPALPRNDRGKVMRRSVRDALANVLKTSAHRLKS